VKRLTLTATLALSTTAHAAVGDDMCRAGVRGTAAGVTTKVKTENGMRVVTTTDFLACGPVASGVACELTVDACAEFSAQCAVTPAIACLAYESRTTGDAGRICKPTYGECERLRTSPSREYIVGAECIVYRRLEER